MNEQVSVQTKTRARPIFTPASSVFLQRAAVNDSPINQISPIVHSVLRSLSQPSDIAVRSSVKPHFAHDFSWVQTHSDPSMVGASSAYLPSFIGGPAAKLSTGHSEVFINGPGGGTTPNPSSPAVRRQPLSTNTAANCPTNIKIARVGQGNDNEFGRTSPITGWGAFAQMEVSDPSSQTWDGAEIHETVRNIKNTCGDEGNKACSNRSGESQKSGSTFKVGSESNFLGLATLPAAKNRFYDLHVFAKKGSSLLHLINQPNCEIQCEQSYDCGGRQIGPDFVITYAMTGGAVPRAGGGSNAVTRVRVSKAVKSTPAASPTADSAGVTH